MASEHTWATVGKALTAAATIVGLILGVIQIADALSGPQVIAIVEKRENVLAPKFREEFAQNVARSDLKKMIEEREKKREPAAKILEAIKERVSKDDDLSFLNFDSLVNSTAWHVTILNKSDEVAKDVKIVFPGAGKVDIVEGAYGTFDGEKKPSEWKREISVGSVPPRATVQLLIWPDEGLAATLFGADIGLMHDGGSGVVRQWQKFYGWDAELVTWFLSQSAVFRWVLAGGAGLFLAVVIWFLFRRGHLVLRPRPARAAPAPPPTDSSAVV